MMMPRTEADGLISRRSMLATTPIALVALARAQTAYASPGGIPSELAQTIDAHANATVANDIPTLSKLVTDDYMLVNSDTTVQDKHSYLADFNVPGFRLEPFTMLDPFAMIWGDAAVTGGRMHLRWQQQGRREARWLRIVNIWTRREERWMLAYTQLTRVPETTR